MFKKRTIGLVTLSYLSSDVRAMRSKYRCQDSQAPWCKGTLASDASWEKPDWDIDYVVPNYGRDTDISMTQDNLREAEGTLKHQMQASFVPPKRGYDIDYAVPNFGKDDDIGLTQDNLDESEQELNHRWVVQKPAKPDPTNYYVPNFGNDGDNMDTNEDLAWAEDNLEHKWVVDFSKKKDPPPRDYFVPNYGLDQDILDTQFNTKRAEKRYGPWNVEQDDVGNFVMVNPIDNSSYNYDDDLLQLKEQTESDPICHSAGCGYRSEDPKKAPFPMNYKVPDFGIDGDVKQTFNSLSHAEKITNNTWNYVHPGKDAKKIPDYRTPDLGLDGDVIGTEASIAHVEKTTGKKWSPVQDENGEWIVPEPINNKSYGYAKSLVQLDSQSDPICSSAGCEYSKVKPAKTHPMNYFVPNFGADQTVSGITQTTESLGSAEKITGHKWNYVKPGKGHPVDYVVPNFGVDEDVKVAQANIAAQEATLGHAWVPEQDDNGYWVVPEAASAKSYTYSDTGAAYSLMQLDDQKSSDPICSSAGCPEKKAKGHPVDYFVPHFGVDDDIKTTQANIKNAENKHGKWTLPKPEEEAKVQLESDPICSSAGCEYSKIVPKKMHPMNYFVPNFGGDRTTSGVVETHESLDWAEKKLDHKWLNAAKGKPKDPIIYDDSKPLDPDMITSLSNLKEQQNVYGEWILPPVADVQLNAESDPICNSSGCNQFKRAAKPLGYPIDYPVQDLGFDHDVVASQNSLNVAEQMRGHRWAFKTKESKAKYENPAKKTMYNFAPELDGDVTTTRGHYQKAEEDLGNWDV